MCFYKLKLVLDGGVDVTPEANVWSLGVLLWEICQLGEMPYSELSDDQVIVKVLGGGVRLPPPALHPRHAPALYSLMCHCWGTAATRPALDHVQAMLNHLHTSHSEEDFQRRWDALKPTTSTPEITLETMTARSDFDSGVDLEIKSTDRDILDLVKKSLSDVNLTPGTSSPQLSVASSSGGEFFSQTSLPVLKKQQSPSLTNLHGSVEDVSRTLEGEKKEVRDTEEFDSWLRGVETNTEEDVKFVKKISEAIKDLDDALALEKTSSSSDDSRQESPMKEDRNPVLDFRLGPMSSNRVTTVGTTQPDSLVDSLRRDSSGTDTEEETWRGRIERGEFSEKVKEKSKSVTDLMILTHIESEGSETDSLPSLTRQYSVDKKKKFTGVGFGSEGNIRGAVLGEEFQDALKQLQAEWKLRDMESRENSLQFVRSEQQPELDFLSNEASEKPSTPSLTTFSETVLIARSEIVEAKIVNDNFQQSSPAARVQCELSPKSMRVVQSPETSESSQTSSSETSTPTQYEVIHVKTFIDSERNHSATINNREITSKYDKDTVGSTSVNLVPNNCVVETKNENLADSSVDVSIDNVQFKCLVSEQNCKPEPSECLVVDEDLLSGFANQDKTDVELLTNENEIEKNVPLTVNDFLLLRDESSCTFVPEIVVTEASILDVDSESENEMVLPNVTRVRRNIRLVMTSSDSENEDDNKVLEDITVSDKSEFTTTGVVTSTPFVRERRCISVDESVSDVDPTFSETTESFFVSSKPPHNQESSVILGSCEDFTLDYFKGLKTTFGKQTSDESTDEFSKSEDEMDDKPLNNWDEFLAETHRQRLQSNIEDVNNDLELNNKNREENTFDYADEMDILNPKIKFDDGFNSVEKTVMMCDQMDIFENLNGKHSQDQQMEEVKNRLEDVAKLSESFCFKNHSMTMEDDEDGKLLTPDDERSSDSGFRDKGSLSESVEDGCDEKYNLEDIEAELEQGEEQTTETEVARDQQGDVVTTIQLSEDVKNERHEERLDKLDIALDSDIDRFFQASQTKGWYLHPPPGTSLDNDGWLPTEAEENGRNLDINEEFVTAIRNELREKLPCAQNPERAETEEDVSPEEERTDLVIQYNTYPAPLSPIFEERESISSNQSSLLLDETGKSLESSGKSSPVIYLDVNKVEDSLRFEEDIKSALDVCSSESTESDNVLVTVEDLEGGDKIQKVKENPKEEIDDLLIVDTETNDVILYESQRPKSQLAFVKQVMESVASSPANSETYTCYHSADDNMLSVDRNNLTCTPDSCTLSPMSTGSSRTGAAVSFSSSETGGNLSGFYLSPSSVRSDLFDSGPPSLPFDLGLMDREVVEPVEEIKPNNEAEEIVQDLVEAGVLVEESESKLSETVESSDLTETETEVDSEKSNDENIENAQETDPDTLQICNTPKNDCDRIDKLLSSEVQIQVPESGLEINSTPQEWLKSVLLSNSEKETKNDKSVSLNPNMWPNAEELLPIVKCEVSVNSPESPSVDLLEIAAKFYDVNSTLAISTPNNVSFDESKDNSQLSSFTSTPTVESKMFFTKLMKAETEVKSVPSLSSLANEIILRFPTEEKNTSEDSPDDSSDREKMLQGMTLALESSVMSKAPMPSPEDADKGSWRPTMNQLMELTSRPEAEDMMTTSFIDADNDNDNDNYTPDWESDSSDDSEDHSSSSGEFIWRDGDKEEAVRVVIACDDLEPQEGTSDRSMARISEGEEEEEDDDEDDSSSCGSTTEFTPSTWDRNATPTKSALRSAEKKKVLGARRNVSFKRQKYHCVYEYPREPGSDDESCIQRPCWQSPSTYDYSTYTDWEYGEGEVESEEEEEEDGVGPRQIPESEYDFYRLSNLDFDMMTPEMNLDDGEFFISSSARPFQMGDSCQFFPGSLGFNDDDFLVEFQPCAADTDALVIPRTGPASLDETVNTELLEVDPKRSSGKLKPEELQLTAELSGESTPAEVSPTLGELRHTRERLKLDLGRTDSAGEDSGVGSSDRLDEEESLDKLQAKSSGDVKRMNDRKVESSEVVNRVEGSKVEPSGNEKRVEVTNVYQSGNVYKLEDSQLNGLERFKVVKIETPVKSVNLEEKNVQSQENCRVEPSWMECVDKAIQINGRMESLENTDTREEIESSAKSSAADSLKGNIDLEFQEKFKVVEGCLERNLAEGSKGSSLHDQDEVETNVELFGKLDRGATDPGEDSGVGSSDKLDQVEDNQLGSSKKQDKLESLVSS
ncbi:uncharacterized protein LOC128999301 isoform X1 [Macrosteles quadrilineatus]|uniref:uncharacterized protein LOC128999301 isoform X1 n=1 Tax=Macrosteles quadrilineatus TaxID=74068 RepID=UPI0023E31198|nr:uncharacterized protein LOC128999301 isoform X1 [Macrosteles quadrilineatus]